MRIDRQDGRQDHGIDGVLEIYSVYTCFESIFFVIPQW